VLDRPRPDDGLGHDAVHAGVGREGGKVDRPRQDMIVAEDRTEGSFERWSHLSGRQYSAAAG